MAAANGQWLECRLIIDSVRDKNPKDHNGWTVLHDAAARGHLDICRLIIAEVEEKNPKEGKDAWTPLHWAALKGHLEVCQLICENIEDKNPKDSYGLTPVIYAGKKEVIDYLSCSKTRAG